MVTVSTSGPIGLLMNVIASLCFVIPAAAIYKAKKSTVTAVIGLLTGVFCMTGSMILWNYLVTPLYTGTPREVIVGMLPTIFLPFNLIKAGINMGLTLMIYKPISTILHKSGILEEHGKNEAETHTETKKKFSPLAIIIGLVIIVLCAVGIVIL